MTSLWTSCFPEFYQKNNVQMNIEQVTGNLGSYGSNVYTVDGFAQKMLQML